MEKKEALNHNRKKYSFFVKLQIYYSLMIKRSDNRDTGKEIIVGDDQSAASG